jgi:hypothetical protein
MQTKPILVFSDIVDNVHTTKDVELRFEEGLGFGV